MPLELTIEALKAAEFRGPVKFYDGRGGMARQDFECVAEPRFGYFWQRESRKDKGRQAYMVDGREVASLDEAVKLLALPPSPDSPDEKLKAWREEFMASPKLAGRATRANSEARCNADAGPFAMQRAWLQRADHPWHVGLNRFSDLEREAGGISRICSTRSRARRTRRTGCSTSSTTTAPRIRACVARAASTAGRARS
jgi:hypothetical protein